MEKVKKSTICKNICLLLALILALGAMAMCFVELVVAIDGSASYKGYEVAFGFNKLVSYDSVTNTVLLEAVWSFSFANFMTYVTLLLAIICCVGAIAYKKQGLVLAVLTMLLFLFAGGGFLSQANNLQPYTQAAREYYEPLVGVSMTVEEVNAKINEIAKAAQSAHQISVWAYVAAAGCFLSAALALLSKILWQVQYVKEK